MSTRETFLGSGVRNRTLKSGRIHWHKANRTAGEGEVGPDGVEPYVPLVKEEDVILTLKEGDFLKLIEDLRPVRTEDLL